MNLGVYIDAHPDIGPAAGMVEQAGFSHLWVYDSPLVFGDPYMAMADAARATETVTIGPGVTHPHARSPLATAQALGSLAKVVPGRVALGLGIGNSARRSLGQPPAGRREMREYAEAVRTLLEGGAVTTGAEGQELAIRFIHPDGRWLDLSRRIELWISAFGPKGQRLAGEYADAVFIRWEGEEATVAARERIDAGSAAAGREPGSVKIATVFAVYPVESEAELEAEEARGALGPLVISRLRYLTANHEDANEVPDAFRAGFEAYSRYREGLDAQTRQILGKAKADVDRMKNEAEARGDDELRRRAITEGWLRSRRQVSPAAADYAELLKRFSSETQKTIEACAAKDLATEPESHRTPERQQELEQRYFGDGRGKEQGGR